MTITEPSGRHAAPPLNGHTQAPFTIAQLGPGPSPPAGVTPPEPARRPDGTAFIVVALFAAAVVAVVAFSGSWQHQYELSIHLGQAHWVAGMQPLSVEGLIAGATLVIWYAARYGCGTPWAAYLVLAAGVGQTVLMNLGADADYRWAWLGPEISVWPAVAFVAAYEMAVWLVRKRQDVARRPDDTPAADVTPDVTPPRAAPPPKPPAKPKPKPKPGGGDREPSKTAMARTALALNPGLSNDALMELTGATLRTVQRARNGSKP